jgi:exo-beta-1,3-glucanase (GH17 family)
MSDDVNAAIQQLFNEHRAAGTVTQLVAAILDVQGIVLATIGFDGLVEVRSSHHTVATAPTVAALDDAVARAAEALRGGEPA